jgi:hypothetical protein
VDSEKFLSIPNLEGKKVPSYSDIKSFLFNNIDLVVSGRSTALIQGSFSSWNPTIWPSEEAIHHETGTFMGSCSQAKFDQIQAWLYDA